MWIVKQLSIPISVSQCPLGGMFGAALTKALAGGHLFLVLIPFAAFALAALFVQFA